jgi:Protein of unknown function (DUF2867)
MPIEFTLATPVEIPALSGITQVYKSLNLADAFAIRLPLSASSDPELLARFIFSHQPSWIGKLTSVRDVIVAGFEVSQAYFSFAMKWSQARLNSASFHSFSLHMAISWSVKT